MTTGGYIIVGTTLGIAALDGALAVFVGAAIIGKTAHWLTLHALNAIPCSIEQAQRELLYAEIANARSKPGVTEQELREAKRKLEEGIAANAEVTRKQMWGNNEVAVSVGLATFACPALGVALMAAATRRYWGPLVGGLVDSVPNKVSFAADLKVALDGSPVA